MGMIRCIGPGLIVAGSIVGSGELIATTKTGAEAGFSLLWLIMLGCVVKVFAQVELGRYALISGKTTLRALDEVPGPRIKGRGNWLVWYWLLMWLASISQLGGIVGGVGQALAISAPITQMGRTTTWPPMRHSCRKSKNIRTMASMIPMLSIPSWLGREWDNDQARHRRRTATARFRVTRRSGPP